MTLWLILVCVSFATPVFAALGVGLKSGFVSIVVGLFLGLGIGVGSAWCLVVVRRLAIARVDNKWPTRQQTFAFILLYIGAFAWICVTSSFALYITRLMIHYVAA
jgi:hypothetical protein